MKSTSINFRIIYILLIVSLAITSCKKDSDNAATLEGGTWTAGTPTVTTMVGTRTLAQYYTEVAGMSASQALQYATIVNALLMQSFTGTIQFNSDNTYTSNLGGTPDDGTWSLSDDGKKLTIDSSSAAPEIADINELTSNKLSVTLTEIVDYDYNNDEITESITVNVTIPFTR